MAYYRRLPSGKWQATVRGPDGRKHTCTDPLKATVRKWAAEPGGAARPGGIPRSPGWARSGSATGRPG